MLLQNLAPAIFSGGRGLEVLPAPVIETSTASTIVLTKPVGTALGDFLAAFVMCNGAVDWTVDAAFTERLDGAGSGIATLVAGGSEPADYTFTRGSSGNEAGTILRIAGGAYDTVGAESSSSGTPTAPQITMSGNGLLIGFFYSTTTGLTFSTPTGMRPLIADNTYGSFAIFTQKVAAGATGTRASTMSSGSGYGALLGVKKA